MRLFKKKKLISGPVFGVLLFVFCFVFFLIAIANVSDEVDENEIKALENAIDKAVLTCYAIEGEYPENIEYIEKNYGVVIDHNKFFVAYNILGPNVRPDVMIAPIGEE